MNTTKNIDIVQMKCIICGQCALKNENIFYGALCTISPSGDYEFINGEAGVTIHEKCLYMSIAYETTTSKELPIAIERSDALSFFS